MLHQALYDLDSLGPESSRMDILLRNPCAAGIGSYIMTASADGWL